MIETTADAVRRMREETGLGMAECKHRLLEQQAQAVVARIRGRGDENMRDVADVLEFLLKPQP